jgi:MazG family protein
MEAEKISKKAAGAGFEWPDINGVVEKLQEEVAELADARQSGDQEHIQHEIGDLLFTLVNLARFLKVDPEQALRQTNARFRRRFAHIERQVAASGNTFSETPLERMEEFWQEAKSLED